MVGDHVHEQLESAVVAVGEEGVELGQVAVGRLDIGVVGHVITVVLLGGRVAGIEPDSVDPEALHVVEP